MKKVEICTAATTAVLRFLYVEVFLSLRAGVNTSLVSVTLTVTLNCLSGAMVTVVVAMVPVVLGSSGATVVTAVTAPAAGGVVSVAPAAVAPSVVVPAAGAAVSSASVGVVSTTFDVVISTTA